MLTLTGGWSTHMSNIEFHWVAMVLAAVASFIPAWRASRVDPVRALRVE